MRARPLRSLVFLAAACALSLDCGGGPNPGTRKQSRPLKASAVCLLDGAEYRTKAHVLEMLEEVERSSGERLIVLPWTPFFGVEEGREKEGLADFAAAARAKRAHLAVALAETGRDGRTFQTSYLIDPKGGIVGKYRKSHRLAWDDAFALGDELPVFKTSFGTVGLTIGSDFYFPEVYDGLRLAGADVLVWQNFPERFRVHENWPPLLFARAFDSHAFLVTAQYADPRTYITHNYDYQMRGAAFGRSMVIDRSGTIRADTGYRHGVATAAFDLDERKVDVYPRTPNFENVFYVPNNGGREAFRPLAQPWTKPVLPSFKKRTARIAVGYAPASRMWKDGTYPDAIMEILGKAAELRPDLVLFSEQDVRDSFAHPDVARGLTAISRWAADHRAYVAIGGIGLAENPASTLHLWDRNGRLAYAQTIYWTGKGGTLKTYDTDFARIASHTCGDLGTYPIDRVLALQGAELILDPSQMWGADGLHNEMLLRARAIDNGCYVACAHWMTSDAGLRSVIVDPYGGIRASSDMSREGVVFADLDFTDSGVYYAGLNARQPQPGAEDIPNYFTSDLPERIPGARDMIFQNRRPELYGSLPEENAVTRRYINKK